MARKKVVALLAACLALSGCGNGTSIKRASNRGVEDLSERFLTDNGADTFRTVVDTRTGVTYLLWERPSGKSSAGGISPLLDKDGNPIISEEVS